LSYFLQNGDVFSPTPGRDAVLNTLPVGNYVVIETMTGLKFQKVDKFTEPGRMYGNIESRATRILDTFMDRPRTTGVLLSGEKGSGKSQLARNISYAGYEMGLPTILVNAPFCGDAFNQLLASVEQPAIVLMDEFEKVYSDQERQEQVLTLLDGMMTSHKLFILTVNNKYRINENMKNRPGRIYYAIDYAGLEAEFIREYCEDNLNDKDQIDNVLKISALFKAFNFDMLKALVEEMNRYKESAFDAIEWLNAKPIDSMDSTSFEVVAISPKGVKSKPTETGELPMSMRGNALGLIFEFEQPVEQGKDALGQFFADLNLDKDDYNQNETADRHLVIQASHLKKVDVDNGHFQFLTEGFTIDFRRKRQAGYNFHDLAY
jgi:hypothetical protein